MFYLVFEDLVNSNRLFESLFRVDFNRDLYKHFDEFSKQEMLPMGGLKKEQRLQLIKDFLHWLRDQKTITKQQEQSVHNTFKIL